MNLIFRSCAPSTWVSMLPKTFLIMRMIVGLMIISCMQVSATSFSQKVTISGKNLSVDKVFTSIQQQTGFLFWYDYDLLQKSRPVSLDVKDAPLNQVLTLISKDQPFTFTLEDNIIVIRKRENAPVNDVRPDDLLIAPLVVIRGTVLNDTGDPLDGAVVELKGSTKKVITNNRGVFSITLSNDQVANGTLVITFVGYNRYEHKIRGEAEITVKLEKSILQLDDVVVTNSYSRPKRREEIVGSIATVSAEQLQANRPIESFDKMLEGLVAGVQVETNTELGTPVTINIRGQNSLSDLQTSGGRQLTTSTQPLFIIDGVPVIEQRRGNDNTIFQNEQLLNPLTGINPDDIESISVLKDAAASAIYGANASNGVIIITTKKGKGGKTSLNLGYNSGIAKSINRATYLTGPQYYELVKEMYINDGRTVFDAELLAGSPDINTDWFELTNRYSSYQNADFDMSGGNEKTQFRFSGSYLEQESIQKGNDFSKTYFRLRLDHEISPKLSFSSSLTPTFTKKNGLNTYSLVPIIPNAPVYNADSTFFKFTNLGVPNPLAVLEQNVNTMSGGSFNGNARLTYRVLPNLSLYTIIGMDGLINKQTQFESPRNPTGENLNGEARINDRTNFTWISSTQANWTPRFKAHKLDIIAGFEAQSQSVKLLRGSATGFTYYRLNELSSAENRSSASSRSVGSSYSVYGQSIYSFSDKYFLSLSGRYDAASIFGEDVNAAVNAGAGASWLVNKENFMRNVRWIDMLKLRFSYGTTGNSRIGSYAARGLYNFDEDGYNGNVSGLPSTAPNERLSWEKSYKTNLGIDFDFLRRFNVTVDIYQSITDDAISPINIDVESGFATSVANIGELKNTGLDASVSMRILDKGAFTWTSTLNIGFNKNVVTEVKNNTVRYAGSNERAGLLKAGESTTAIWGFKFAGVDPTTGREQYYDNTGKIVSVFDLDRNLRSAYDIGNRLPDAQGGFINNFGYKNIRISVLINYSFGADKLISYLEENNGRNLSNRNQSVNLIRRWQKPGDITDIPLLSASTNPIVSNSSRYVYDDTYLKLGNVSISYRIPESITRVTKSTISVFANGTNLFYWYRNDSPEGFNGIREYKYTFPEAQTFTAGVTVGF